MKTSNPSEMSRRQFVQTTLTAAAAAAVLGAPSRVRAAETAVPVPGRRIKLGVIGNGGRGAWIAGLFRDHGGYEMWAVADYFHDVADACGRELGVDPTRRFSTLSGYQRLIESGVEAVAIETPPYFIPEQAAAAVQAGLHVYLAKPVAVDVPGAVAIAALGERATRQHRCFLVDYQMPTAELNQAVAQRIRQGALGKLSRVVTTGYTEPQKDPPRTATMESRLRELIWVNDVAMSCDYIGNYDIHAIDAVLWVLGRRPIAAMGTSDICRIDPHGDARDVCSLTYQYADGLVHQHAGQALRNQTPGELSAAFYGNEAHALVNYWGRAFVRGGQQHFGGGTVDDLYEAGAKANIDRFHREVTSGQITNDTHTRAVDGVLTCVLGYEAAARRTRLTMEEILRENRRLEVDLRGLKS